MRWTQINGKIGDRRIITRFLLFPTCFDNEWRWLEKARIVQVLKPDWACSGGEYLKWKNFRWAD